jgi:hypothetical protein
MGRADIAILSEISFRIRLCLHPPALSMEGLAYDSKEPFRASRFLSRHVGRAASGDSSEPSHHAHILRAQSLRGHMGRSFLPVIDLPQPTRIPARPMAGQRLCWLRPLCKHPPGTYIPERIPLPEDVSIILYVLSIRRSALSGANLLGCFPSCLASAAKPTLLALYP